MKTTSPERRLLEYIEMNADSSLDKMAKALNMRAHSIRYYIEKFRSSKIITARAFIDTYRLGYQTYIVRFSLNGRREDISNLLNDFQSSDKVSWMIELGGDYQYEVQLTVRSLREFIDFFDNIDTSSAGVIATKNVALLTSYSFFGTRCLMSSYCSKNERNKFRTSMTVCDDDEKVEIDEIDHRLLRKLMTDEMTSESDMARTLGLPPTTVSHRIRLLEKRGVIKAYMYTIAGEQLGLSYYLLLLSLRGINDKVFQSFQRLCEQFPCIRSLVRAIGSWDVEIRLSVERYQQVVETIEGLRDSIGPTLVESKVLPYFSLLKMQDYPFDELLEPSSNQERVRDKAASNYVGKNL